MDERCKRCVHFGEDQSEYHYCHVCDMDHDCFDEHLPLPRLLTLEEVCAVHPHEDYLWLETTEDYEVFHLQIYGFGGGGDIFFDIPQDTLECPAQWYGKDWRCWSDRPTYEWRRMVQWDA